MFNIAVALSLTVKCSKLGS